MATVLVNVFREESDEYAHTLLAQHDDHRDFQEDFYAVLDVVRDDPGWTISEVYEKMKAIGWTMVPLDCLEVEF